MSVPSVNKPAAAFSLGEAEFLPQINMYLWFFFFVFVTKLRQGNWKQWQHYFMQITGWVKQKDAPGNWMYQAALWGSQLFATLLCLWKGTDTGIGGWGSRWPWQSVVSAPASLFAQPSQVASSCDLSYAAEMGESTLAAIFHPSLA